VLLALFTPVADPARLAVADQVRRLQQGRVTPLAFDYGFLRFEGARYGRAALDRLAAQRGGPRVTAIAAGARRALEAKSRYALDGDRAAKLAPPRIAVHPAGRTLPPGFPPGGGGEGDPSTADCSGGSVVRCHAFFLDLNGDGAEEILLSGPAGLRLAARGPGGWRWEGRLQPDRFFCDDLAAMQAGQGRAVPTPWRDLEVNGHRYGLDRGFTGEWTCLSGGRPTGAPPARPGSPPRALTPGRSEAAVR